MQLQPRRDTSCELAVRSRLHRLGLRYRVDARPLADFRRRADIVFRSARVAVFVDGCFWHGCARHSSLPTANRAWWSAKIDRNRRRDRETDLLLKSAGWVVMRFWEHEEASAVARSVAKAVRGRLDAGS